MIAPFARESRKLKRLTNPAGLRVAVQDQQSGMRPDRTLSFQGGNRIVHALPLTAFDPAHPFYDIFQIVGRKYVVALNLESLENPLPFLFTHPPARAENADRFIHMLGKAASRLAVRVDPRILGVAVLKYLVSPF